MLIIGGQRSLTGAVVGVIVVSALQEALRQIESTIEVFGLSQLMVAFIMLAILIVRPAGLTKGREIPWPFGQRSSVWRRLAPRSLPRAATWMKI